MPAGYSGTTDSNKGETVKGLHGRKKRRTKGFAALSLALGVVGVLLLSIVAYGVTNDLTLRAGNSEAITCPNALTNTNVKADSETVNCASQGTLTTTTIAPTTTTVAGTTTT